MEAKLRSISKLWQDTFDLFMKHIGNLLLLALIPALGIFVLTIILVGGVIGVAAVADPSAFDFSQGIAPALGFYSMFGAFAILAILVQLVGVLSITVYINDHKKPLSLKETLKKTGQLFWKFLGLSLIIIAVGLFVLTVGSLLVALVVGGLTRVIGASEEFFLVVFFLSLAIPIIATAILGVYWNFSQYYLVDKNSGVWEAFTTSFKLVRGNFWQITLRLILFIVPVFALSMVFSIIPILGSILSTIIIPPLTVVYYYDIYRDLVKKK